MYSRNTWDRQNYSLPPGYDGSRFRRRQRRGEEGRYNDDEVIVVPDSSYAAIEDTESHRESDGELSVGGIPTDRGKQYDKRHFANAENAREESLSDDIPAKADESTPEHTQSRDRISDIISKLGFPRGLSSDDLLLCAVIFIIASDVHDDGRSVGDILLILALLLGIK